MSATLSLRLCCALVLLAGVVTVLADPATKPATQPTTQSAKADEVVAVAKGSIDLRLDLDGTFAPLDATEVRTKTKAYQGEFTIVRVADAGPVKQGDVLLEIGPKHLKRHITQAAVEVANARANLEKAKGDLALAAAGDALETKRAQDQIRYAEEALQWWNSNDAKMLALSSDVSDKIDTFQAESAEDELDQLKKMYKSDDLANETADIVMKRATRILDILRLMRDVGGMQTKKVKDYLLTYQREQIANRLEGAQHGLKQLALNQQQQQVTRRSAAEAAAVAVETAEDKLADLRSDMDALTVKAPADGVLVYGTFKNKAWQPTPPETLRIGEKLQAQQTVMTLVHPGRVAVVSDLPESKLSYLAPGSKARIIPVSSPEGSYPITVSRIEALAMSQSFDVWFDIPNAPGLLPGMKGSIIVPGDKLENVLVVPVSAVSRNRVWVRVGEKDEPRDVTLGRSDGTNVEIKAGLEVGEKVLKSAKK